LKETDISQDIDGSVTTLSNNRYMTTYR